MNIDFSFTMNMVFEINTYTFFCRKAASKTMVQSMSDNDKYPDKVVQLDFYLLVE